MAVSELVSRPPDYSLPSLGKIPWEKLKMKKVSLAAMTLLALGVFAGGCTQQQQNSASTDLDHTVAVANQAVVKAADDAKPKLAALDLGARVTTALAANQNIPVGEVRVDANPNGVRLRGTVDTAREKHLAAQIAKDTLGPGKSVANDLAVKGS
jgi:hypothetical protein